MTSALIDTNSDFSVFMSLLWFMILKSKVNDLSGPVSGVMVILDSVLFPLAHIPVTLTSLLNGTSIMV